MKMLMDLGCIVKVPDTSKVYVEVGLGCRIHSK